MRAFDENGIPYIVSPYEADPQLAYTLNIGLIHAIISTDSDFWALNDNPCVIMDLNTTNLKAHICIDQGSDLSWAGDPLSVQAADSRRDTPHHHMTRFGAIVRAVVYGNDYLPGGLQNMGDKTLRASLGKICG